MRTDVLNCKDDLHAAIGLANSKCRKPVLELGKVCIPLTSQSLFGETGIGGGVLIKLSRFISAMTTGVGDMQCTAGD